MSLVATFDPVLSRVRLTGSGLDASPATAKFERSRNGLRWTTVRGGSAVPVSGGNAAIDDYEFAAGVVNHYRVTNGTGVQSRDPLTSTTAEDMTTTETIWDMTAVNSADTWTPGADPAGMYDWTVGTERVRVVGMTAPTGSGPFPQQATVTRSINGVVTTQPLAAAVHLYAPTFTTTITPAQTTVWLKSITRPFLNRAVAVVDYDDITRAARNDVVPIIGRSYPIAVTDVRLAREWQLKVKADTVADADAIELVLASGDPLYIQVPATGALATIPGGYVVVGDMTRSKYGHLSARRWFNLPITEVAPPGPDVVGTTFTWDALVAEFGSWNAVLAAFGTWAEVADYVADPETVIVP